MTKVDFKYGFPLFCNDLSGNLLKLEKNRVSDLWALLHYVIKQYVKWKPKAIEEFLLSLHEQAKYFYKAAESAPVKSQPLLFYYSLLNLAKIYLCIVQNTSPSDVYMHGIETKVNAVTTIQTAEVNIQALHGSPRISVAHRLFTSFGDQILPIGPTTLQVKECMASCMGIHRTYCETYNETESFVRLLNPEACREGTKLEFVSEVKGCDVGILNSLLARGYNVTMEEGKCVYREQITMPHYNIRKQD